MQCHLLSFEGPDLYAQAGGLASRITGLSHALVKAGFETHLWFVGDPELPGHENRNGLQLHRWCQWISHYHPGGVYDGEEGKRSDYAASLPPFLFKQVLLPSLERLNQAVIMAEDWHTVDAVFYLDWLLRQRGFRQQVTMLWNANNTFGFDRIDWERLCKAAVITTVSRYMKGLMQRSGTNPIVIPNGLPKDAYLLPQKEAVKVFHDRLHGRTVITKVARWDPAKRWLLGIESVAVMKRESLRPLFIARGGTEYHREEVLKTATALGLHVAERAFPSSDVHGLLDALDGLDKVDVVSLLSPLDPTARGLLFHGSDAVLANSSHEPFGLVGLETMAVEGVACIGNTGEDYALPGYNVLALEANDPWEFISRLCALKENPLREWKLRRAGRRTAQEYTWPKVVRRILLPGLIGLPGPRRPQSPVKAA